MSSAPTSKPIGKLLPESLFFIDFVRVTGAIPALLWTRPKVYYIGDRKKSRVKKGGVLIASNHISFTDPVLLYSVFWYRRVRSMATKDLYKNNLVSMMFSAVGCVMVDKENFNMGSLHTAIDKLKAGQALLIFPEGQVNRRQEMLSFKTGAVLMAQLSGAPIQPVYIAKPKKWYQRHVAVVGEPIDVRGRCSRFPSMEELNQVSEYVHDCELALEQYYIQKTTKRGFV